MSLRTQEISIEREAPEIDEAISLTAAGFVRPINEELTNDVRSHLDDGHDFYSVSDEEGRKIAYSIFCEYKTSIGNILYLSGVIIDPEHQGKGLSSDIVDKAFDDYNPEYFSFRTQSARMYEAGRKMVDILYPKIDDIYDIPNDIQTAGEFIASIKGGRFPVTERCYGGKPLYGEMPNNDSSDEFYKYCDFNRGDAVLCVGRPTMSKVRTQ